MMQGKCGRCKVRWVWQGARTQRQGVRCPCCGGPIEQTTHFLQWPRRLATRQQIGGRPVYTPHCFGKKGCLRPTSTAELLELERLDGENPMVARVESPGA